jgi:23S rRNA G2445 N2-methylase RlmL
MRIISICHPGTEDICATEIREYCSVDTELHESAVIFDAPEKVVLQYCYFSQASIRILGFLGYTKFESLEHLIEFAKKISLAGWAKKDTSFKVECTRIGEHDFTSETLQKDLGEVFYEKDKLKVNLSNPDMIIYVYIHDNNCYLGVDMAGFDLSKRDYKMFAPPESLKGTIAYSLLRIANYHPSDVLLFW